MMLRNIGDAKRSASISKFGLLVVMYDEGWEDLVDYKQQFASVAEAKASLGEGWEEYDPNAGLKAAGFIWNGYCYVKGEV